VIAVDVIQHCYRRESHTLHTRPVRNNVCSMQPLLHRTEQITDIQTLKFCPYQKHRVSFIDLERGNCLRYSWNE